jgi:anti-sigma factor RsiW
MPRITCAELAELVTDYVEGVMPRGRSRAFERHVARCGDCDVYLDQMRHTIEATGRLAADDVESVPRSVRDRLLEAFRAANGAPGP